MSAVVVEVAEAVKEQLNGHDFGIPLEAVRVHARRRLKADKLTELRVDVVPVMWTNGLASRGSGDTDAIVDVFIRKKMTETEQDHEGQVANEEIDTLVELAEDIADLFRPEQPNRDGGLTDYDQASWKETKVMSGYVTDKFAQTRIFMAQIRLTFNV